MPDDVVDEELVLAVDPPEELDGSPELDEEALKLSGGEEVQAAAAMSAREAIPKGVTLGRRAEGWLTRARPRGDVSD